MSTQRYGAVVPALILGIALTTSPSAQTQIALADNKYSPADDVKLGQEAAAEVRKELPMLDNRQVDAWVGRVGQTLVAAIPEAYHHQEFRYTFGVVNQRDINAFALPGGPMFLNRGMIEAASSEGEVAGVMAHEIAHVALRHGTAQATKGEKFQLGAIAGQVLGAIVGGTAGGLIAQGSQFGLGTYFLKYGREYEREADLLGAQILARAGYDPREMASMFKTIEAQGGSSGPEWLSSHPNPGNRFEAINREASTLSVQGKAGTGQFASIKSRLAGMPPAPTAEEIARNRPAPRGGTAPAPTAGRTVQVAPPSSEYRNDQPGDFLRLSVPVNWSAVNASAGGVTYAPEGAFFQAQNGQTAFTHGLQLGVAPEGTGDLQRDTEQLLSGFARSNPQLRRQGNARRERIGGRQGLTTSLSNVSEVTGRPETVIVSTAHLPDGSLFFVIGVAPQDEARPYENAFRRVRQSVRLANR